jgi:hypothetical protein
MPTKSQGYYGNKPIKQNEGNGGLRVAPVPMAEPLMQPCKECPLRRDSLPGYLGGYTPEMYIEILHSPASIACHSSKGFHEGDLSTQRSCTGVAAFRANVGHRCLYKGVETHAQYATEIVGSDKERYFASDEEFVVHHKPGQS